jgi:hypothetical protein
VGSTAPFVGLFGTVWGIYHALTAIGISGQASIDKVAGPVGEALIMTAIGLAVAVPAVMGYNWLIRRNTPMTDINMVPLIDVMLVLLVIFIVTAPLLTHAVKLDLPKASAQVNELKPDKIEYAIDAQGQRYYNGVPVTRAQAAERFAAGRPDEAAAGTAPACRPVRGLPRGGRNPGRRRQCWFDAHRLRQRTDAVKLSWGSLSSAFRRS